MECLECASVSNPVYVVSNIYVITNKEIIEKVEAKVNTRKKGQAR